MIVNWMPAMLCVLPLAGWTLSVLGYWIYNEVR